ETLLARRQVIGTEEPIAALRPYGLIQTPNIIDDMADLRRLYQYLRGRNVWHATGTEIASYIIARERSLVYDVSRDGFSIRYDGRVDRPSLTMAIDGSAICSPADPFIEVITPDGDTVDSGACRFDGKRYRHRVTLAVMNGRYQVRAVADTGGR